jgi:hypothetical protein
VLAAGAPAPTRNIFCEPNEGLCFNLTATVKSFDDASAACTAMTGRLVTYTTAAKQLMVEQVGGAAQARAPGGSSCSLPRWQLHLLLLMALNPCPSQYFKSKSTLPSTGYWLGVVANTSDSSGGFMFADNSTVPQNYSAMPYAHWAWNYNTKRSAGGYSCVVARGSQSYDFFIGDSSQLNLKTFYSSTLDNKLGWDLEVGSGAACWHAGSSWGSNQARCCATLQLRHLCAAGRTLRFAASALSHPGRALLLYRRRAAAPCTPTSARCPPRGTPACRRRRPARRRPRRPTPPCLPRLPAAVSAVAGLPSSRSATEGLCGTNGLAEQQFEASVPAPAEPPSNRTFVCDPYNKYCYSWQPSPATFRAAANSCSSKGGVLARWAPCSRSR